MSETRSHIPTAILDALPLGVKEALEQMPVEKQDMFLEKFRRGRKSIIICYILWFLWCHLLYLRNYKRQVLFWFTAGGVMLWWFSDLFTIPGMVRDVNKVKAIEVLRNLD